MQRKELLNACFFGPRFRRRDYFWTAPKVTKKALEPTDSRPPLMHPVTVFAIPGLLSGNRALAFDVPSAGRPPFFILEKRRRPPSSLKAADI